jgi:valyl-tRNA synthetase
VQDDSEAALLSSQISTIVTLIKGCKSMKVVREIADIPEGSGSITITPTVTEYVLVRGQVDLEAEIAKTEKKLGLARMNLEKILKIEAQPDYAATVPENARSSNEEKVRFTASLV